MSRAPWVHARSPSARFPAGHETLYSTTLGWRMVNPKMPEQWTISLGEERGEARRHLRDLARGPGRVRAAQPPAAPTRPGTRAVYREVVPVPGVELRARRGRSAPTPRWRSSAKLKPAFVEDGTVTAGNSSPLNDGASMLLLGDEARRERIGAEPLARVVSRGVARRRPRRLRDRAGRGRQQGARERPGSAGTTSTSVELNEAFASQSPRLPARAGPTSIPRSST